MSLQVEKTAAQAELSDLRNRIWEVRSGADVAEQRARDEAADLSRRMHEALMAERRAQVGSHESCSLLAAVTTVFLRCVCKSFATCACSCARSHQVTCEGCC